MKTLRPYQQEAIDATYDYLSRAKGNPLIVLPTGAGKSLVMAHFIADLVSRYKNIKIVLLAHVKELLRQNKEELLSYAPFLDVGVYSAGLKSKELHNQITIAGIQSIHRHADKVGKVHIVIVDECDLISPQEETTYRSFLLHLKAIYPQMRIIGLTATPYRLDYGYIHKGEDAMFQAISYEANVGDLIAQGYLCKLTSKVTKTHYNLDGVGKRGGEFIAGELENAVNVDEVTAAACAEVMELGVDRKRWLIFASGVNHAHSIGAHLTALGVESGVVTGDTLPMERDTIVNRYKAGELKCLVNVNVFTAGFNVPDVDLIAIMRPTESTRLYVQMVGRGLRNAPGKADCRILDFAQNIERHGPIDGISVTVNRGDGKGEAPTKICPKCGEYVHAACTICPACEFVFPPREIKIDREASEAEILGAAPAWQVVDDWTCQRWLGKGKDIPTMRVDYQVGWGKAISEWVCFEHEGFARNKAESWWRRMGGLLPFPENVTDAIFRFEECKCPKELLTKAEGKYTRVVDYRWDEECEDQPLPVSVDGYVSDLPDVDIPF